MVLLYSPYFWPSSILDHFHNSEFPDLHSFELLPYLPDKFNSGQDFKYEVMDR